MNTFSSTNLALIDRKLTPFSDFMAVAEPLALESASPEHRQHAAVCRENCAQLTLGIVHEMNNLTGGIAVLSEIYLNGCDSDAHLAEGMELIYKSTRRLQTFVAHLKTIHGPISGEPTYFNVGESVRGAFDLFAPALPKSVTVATDLPDEELAACLDEAAFRQLLLDLTLNLRDALASHAQAGGQGLRLALRRLSSGQAELTVAPAADFADGASAFSPDGDARARQQDAAEIARTLGIGLMHRVGGGYALELPLIS